MALAGMGVAMKITMITGMICIGFGQGIQPLLVYCVGAGMWRRFKLVMKCSILCSFGLSAVMTIICYFFVNQIVSVFLTEASAFNYAASLPNPAVCQLPFSICFTFFPTHCRP